MSGFIDSSKFMAGNTCDKNYSKAKMKRRLAQIYESIVRYLDQIESVDRVDPGGSGDKVDRLARQDRYLEGRDTAVEKARCPDASVTGTNGMSIAESLRSMGPSEAF